MKNYRAGNELIIIIRINKTQSAVFKFCRFLYFGRIHFSVLEGSIYPDYLGSQILCFFGTTLISKRCKLIRICTTRSSDTIEMKAFIAFSIFQKIIAHRKKHIFFQISSVKLKRVVLRWDASYLENSAVPDQLGSKEAI